VFDGAYWFIAPIIGPFIGGVLGVLTYDLFVAPYLPGEQPVAKAVQAAPELA
jgi:hypothetical protein